MFVHRLWWLRLLLLVTFLVFAGRLVQLQVIHGAALRRDSEHNHLRWVRTPAPRGIVTDRQGRVLVTSEPGMTAWLVPGEVERAQWPHLLTRMTSLGLYPNQDAARQALDDYRRYSSYLPVRLASRLNIETVTRIEEESAFLPGVYLRAEPTRAYPHGALAAQTLGFLREIDGPELAVLRERGYRPGDRIGKAGIERAFEEMLRGTEGGEQVAVDAVGRVLRTMHTRDPQPGVTIALTLDLAVQQAAEKAMEHRRGAVVALDPANGDILALVSAPAFDLNAMSGRITPEMLAWLQGTAHPQLHRATSGMYAPGSVFKIVTAAAALEKGHVQSNAHYYCEGKYQNIHCWKRSGHGALNLTQAMAQSCNVAFMKMAERVGIDELADMARRFGLGSPTGIGPTVAPLLPSDDDARRVGILPEAAGVVPDPGRAGRRTWMPGETLQVGIGQSRLTTTPLQAARVIAAIANGGGLAHPRLVKSINGQETPAQRPPALGLKAETLRRLTLGLRAAATEGTARQLDATLRIAGKTGTAQNPRGEDHAWFVGYAPADVPVIAVAVLVEHGGGGSAVAAPIAEAVVRAALASPNPR